MKKVTMFLSEFLQFRQTCEKFRILFDYEVRKGGVYEISANAAQLETIGY